MNSRSVTRVLGFIAVCLGLAMLAPAALAFLDHEDFIPLLVSASLPLSSGLIALLATRGPKVDLKVRDGFAVVTFAWIIASLFGALPYLLTGAAPRFADALFEAMSGFTTTGATIFPDVESLSRGVLLWRGITQWLGGMGIVLLSVAVLPLLGVGGMQLYRAEVPGPIADRLSPRIQSTAKALWSVYLALTVAEVVLLVLGGMSLFDAVCHSFTTVSTGGFSTRNASVGAFGSAYLEGVVIAFMFLAGMNFSLHLSLIRPSRWSRYVANEELRFYALVVLVSAGAIAAGLYFGTGKGIGESARQSLFQTVSILTTTGFGTADYLLWGFGAQVLLFLLMFLGACTGSTAGGLKFMRLIILCRHAASSARKEIHPRAIFTIRYAGKAVSDDVLLNILAFFLFYMFFFFAVGLVVAACGVDLETSLGASIATLSNIGPGLGRVGPAGNYAGLPEVAKGALTFSMLLGRLELYTVLVVLSPMFWRRR